MVWLSNARYGQPAESGSVFSAMCLHSIKIHKYKGCGDIWFLSCATLGFDTIDLETETFDIAVKKSKQIIKERIEQFNKMYIPFIEDSSENTFSK